MASVTIPGSRHATSVQGDPLVPRMLLGLRLRELREAAGLSREDAGAAIRGSSSKISRLELGRIGCKRRDIADLLSLYGVSDEAPRATLLALADQANGRAWWHADRDIVPEWVRPYLSAEQTARLVRCFESQFVPGLLQTEDYAREVIRRVVPEHEVDRRVDLRMGRQRVLRRRPRPLNLWAVLDESALWRPIGGPRTMRAQLQHIIDLCGRPNVTVQIAPYGICGRVAGDGPVTLVRFPQQGLPDMVYLERHNSAVYPFRRAEIEHHWHTFNTLVTEAAPPEQTVPILRRTLDTY
ncbi:MULTISPECIES: helix-turn-helix domain-containing protein [Thermomonosporaceae]|uniref:helix-turn-helix domain-containing protein n=1 Tax=Thermomonosporaceae TaxID=2012 RepID=UPI00255AA80B|nr:MULTISPECIES: helix-turn-helix transcriptional regulator [Thermomonosporaceae]MDL4773119.1 helix-turn-helix transcriptional regulator [Actinomadura xylanilytica]